MKHILHFLTVCLSTLPLISFFQCQCWALDIDNVYPTLGDRNSGLDVTIYGSSFNEDTRLSLFLDSGNSVNIAGSWDISPGRAWGLDVVDNKAYIADYSGGKLHIVNIEDPTHPVLVASSDKISGVSPMDVQVVGKLAYIAGNLGGLQVMNVDPFNTGTYMTVIDTFDTSGNAREVDVVDGVAYVADTAAGLQIINFNNPAKNATVDTPGTAFEVNVVNQKAYVADGAGGLRIYNVDPDSQDYTNLIDTVTSLHYPRGLEVINNLAFVADFDAGLKIINIDTESSDYKKTIGVSDSIGAYEVTVVNNIAYIADSSLGLKVVDVSNPKDPYPLGAVDTASSARDVIVKGTIAYVADDDGGLQVVDVNRPDPPTVMGSVDTPGLASGIQVVNNNAYIADWSGGLRIMNVSEPANPAFSSSVTTPGDAADVYVSAVDLIAYVADWESGLQLVDVDPSNTGTFMTIIGDYDTPGKARAVFVNGYTAYVADGTGWLQFINISDPEHPAIIDPPPGTEPPPEFPSANDVFVANNIAYVADGNYGLQLVDVNPSNTETFMEIIDEYDPPAGIVYYSVAVDNNIAYVTAGQDGLQMIDVNPANTETYLTVIGSISTTYWANDVIVSGNTVYLTDGSSGVYMIDVTDPTPVIVGSVDTPGWASETSIINNTAYVADGPSGLSILPLPEEITLTPGTYTATEITVSLPSPRIEGNYTLRAFDDTSESKLNGAVTYADVIELLSSKAIIVAGGGPNSGNQIWEETKAYANQAYDNLIYQGYKHEDIYYLTDQADPLDDRYDTQVVDQHAIVEAATKANLEDAITTWAKSGGTSDLLIFMEDHGEAEKFLMRGGASPQYVTADELDTWLDNLQCSGSASCLPGKVILVYDACNSGSFIARLTPPSGKKRYILTSSTPDQVAYFLSPSHSFSSHFWSTFSGKSGDQAIMTDAFDRAAVEMASYQTAQYDADGDGVPNQQSDYDELKNHEGTIYALRRQFYHKDRFKPIIAYINDDQYTSGSSATLWARSVYDYDGDTIERVWAEVVAPDFAPDRTGQTVVSLPSISLTDPDLDGLYQATCPEDAANCPPGFNFDKRGTYIVTYYAEDSSGIYSLPKISLVRQTGGTLKVVPDLYENDNNLVGANVIVVNDPSPRNHSFHTANDEDWVKFYGLLGVKYSVKAMHPTIISDPVIRVYGSNGTTLKAISDSSGSGEEESLNWTCPADGLYYVRLTNNSGHYGANVRYKLKVYNPIAFSLPGYVKGKITSGGKGVAGAVIRAGSGTAITLADGSFVLCLKPDSYSVSVSCSGYQSTTFAVNVSSGQSVSLTRDMNSIPQIVNSPPGVIKVNKLYSYTPVVVDADGDPLTFSIIGKPGWASFSTANGRLWGTPSMAHEGIHGPITIRVSDNVGATDSVTFNIKVTKTPGGALPGVFLLLQK